MIRVAPVGVRDVQLGVRAHGGGLASVSSQRTTDVRRPRRRARRSRRCGRHRKSARSLRRVVASPPGVACGQATRRRAAIDRSHAVRRGRSRGGRRRAGRWLVVHEGASGRVDDAMFLALRPRLGPERPASPASARARCPDSGCRSRLPPGCAPIGSPRVRTPSRRCRAGAGPAPASGRRGHHRRSQFASYSPYCTLYLMDTPYGSGPSPVWERPEPQPRAAPVPLSRARSPPRRSGSPTHTASTGYRYARSPRARRRPDAALRLLDPSKNCST